MWSALLQSRFAEAVAEAASPGRPAPRRRARGAKSQGARPPAGSGHGAATLLQRQALPWTGEAAYRAEHVAPIFVPGEQPLRLLSPRLRKVEGGLLPVSDARVDIAQPPEGQAEPVVRLWAGSVGAT